MAESLNILRAKLRTAQLPEITDLFLHMESVKMEEGLRTTAYQLLARLDEGLPRWQSEKNDKMIKRMWVNVYRMKSQIPQWVEQYYTSRQIWGQIEKRWDTFLSVFKTLATALLDKLKWILKTMGKPLSKIIKFVKWLPFLVVTATIGVGVGAYFIIRGVVRSEAGREFQKEAGRSLGRLPSQIIKAKVAPETLLMK
jgi:hypothetical protein